MTAELSMPHLLMPHTARWFELLEQFNPKQAELTSMVIRRARVTKLKNEVGKERGASI